MKNSSTLYIIGAFAAGFILHRVFNSRKQEESIPTIPLNKDLVVAQTSTTPVSGTSQTILDGFNENEAQLLKEELNR